MDPRSLTHQILKLTPLTGLGYSVGFLPIPPPREISIRVTICYRTIITFTVFKIQKNNHMNPYYPIVSCQNLVLPSLITDPMLLRDTHMNPLRPRKQTILSTDSLCYYVTNDRKSSLLPSHQPEISFRSFGSCLSHELRAQTTYQVNPLKSRNN